jgi:non-heme chloroperoxidase
MENLLQIIGTNIIISLLIYLFISSFLILLNKSKKDSNANSHISFKELLLDYSELPIYLSFKCRDNIDLNYRYYESDSNNVLILIHGSGWHSDYFLPLAQYISNKNIAHVYTPNLRGHGKNPKRRGDIAYINQLEDDLADFISIIKQKHTSSKIILGGHSSGGGLVTRFAGSKYRDESDAYLLLAPYLKYNAPTTKINSGGWALPHTPRIIGLSMLNNIGIKMFNYLKIIDFNLPKDYRNGTETLSYSYRLNIGYAPRNYKKDLKTIQKEILVVSGKSDEVLHSEKFPTEITKYNTKALVKVIENVTHMGIVVGNEVQAIIGKWIYDLK